MSTGRLSDSGRGVLCQLIWPRLRVKSSYLRVKLELDHLARVYLQLIRRERQGPVHSNLNDVYSDLTLARSFA